RMFFVRYGGQKPTFSAIGRPIEIVMVNGLWPIRSRVWRQPFGRLSPGGLYNLSVRYSRNETKPKRQRLAASGQRWTQASGPTPTNACE
ncbi:hypothetical protein, partial [Mesorhizobium sp. M2E.F.Ca.ET.209.01.1.1]|uniref:hypothetical protein n=1 Tax=Mesorhizobium sp. M2E.F.Ca.ET.209.01.1.1 TaxID=2500526 RepID=UPI001AEF205D